MRYILFLILCFSAAFAADPFDTPELKKAQADVKAAEQRYLALFKEALATSGLEAVQAPTLSADPKDSEHAKLNAIRTFNKDLGAFQFSLKNHETYLNEDVTSHTFYLLQNAKTILAQRKALEAKWLLKTEPVAEKKESPKPKLKVTLADGTIVEQ